MALETSLLANPKNGSLQEPIFLLRLGKESTSSYLLQLDGYLSASLREHGFHLLANVVPHAVGALDVDSCEKQHRLQSPGHAANHWK